MMKSKLRSSLIFLVLFIVSCSKKSSEIIDKPTVCKISSYNVGNTTIDYTYSSEGKLIKSKYNKYDETYTYNSNEIIWEILFPHGGVDTIVYKINNGKAVSSHYDLGIDVELTYNNDYLTVAEITDDNDGSRYRKFEYTWTNGNLTNVVVKTVGISNTYTIEYLDDLRPEGFNYDYCSYAFHSWHGTESGILTNGVFGKMPKNLVSKISNSNGYATYTYQRDSNGKIIQMNETKGSVLTVWTFEYICD